MKTHRILWVVVTHESVSFVCPQQPGSRHTQKYQLVLISVEHPAWMMGKDDEAGLGKLTP